MWSALEHKIPPPVVALLIAAGMYGLDALWPPGRFLLPYSTLTIAAVAGTGLAFDIAGLVSFRRAQTTVNPLQPDKAATLVTTGIYQFTRNPMYLGLALLLLAWALYLANFLAFLGPIALVLYLTRFQILPEERVMQRLFGNDFATYRIRVRRWF